LSTYNGRDLSASVESVDLPVRSATVLARLSPCAGSSLDNTYLVQASEEDIVDSSALRRSVGEEIMGMQMCEAVAKCDGMEGSSEVLYLACHHWEGQMANVTSSVYRKKDLREIILVLTTSFLFEPSDHLLRVSHASRRGRAVTALPKRPQSSSREQMGRLVPALTAKK